ncbi:MAG: hypothetical protein ACXW2E_00460 [Nitrososphaeraceae archaeon]
MICSLVVIGNVGCSLFNKEQPTVDKIVYVTTPLPIIPRPSLPTWSGNDMACLDENVKQNIRDRDRLRREYAEQLEAIIKSTQSR